MELRGATALITGGAHRLGRAIALGLAESGADVALTYFASAAAARETQTAIEQRGVRALTLRADASDDRQIAAALSTVSRRFGRLDLWIANAGVFRRTPLRSVTAADWHDMLRLNLGTFLVPARRIGPLMQRQGGGAIIALGDVAAEQAWTDYLPYSIAKRGVAALAVALARHLAPTVRVNVIAPGPVLFPPGFPAAARRREIRRTLLKRAGSAEDVVAAVRYLATADYVTGVVLPVDGGRRLA
ncbi:MAG: SDR family NAD(P)-dependent oxidoreductase [Candidatus Binatia bacterium]